MEEVLADMRARYAHLATEDWLKALASLTMQYRLPSDWDTPAVRDKRARLETEAGDALPADWTDVLKRAVKEYDAERLVLVGERLRRFRF